VPSKSQMTSNRPGRVASSAMDRIATATAGAVLLPVEVALPRAVLPPGLKG
jgi:hypothetical protein